MEDNKASLLLKKYVAGYCTAEEKAMLESWYLARDLNFPDMSVQERLEHKQEIFAALEKAMAPKQPKPNWLKISAAAAVLAVVIFSIWQYEPSKPGIHTASPQLSGQDIAPGSNKATLQLANGQTIHLNGDKAGIVIRAGQLAYNDGTRIEAGLTGKENAAAINTITTPVGGQYQVILEDGTKVWLNAASSLSYPTHFSGGKRTVTINGEAYFDVAHNKNKPFTVSSKNQTITVLGTQFNVMAYENEQVVKTTLLKGSVQVSALSGQANAVVLKPGEQAQLSQTRVAITANVDLEEVVSWKNGYFKFNENIKSIMNKIARWYDIEVVYRPGVDLNQTFSGEVSKSRNVSALLKVMELTGNVHFKIEERRIIVMP
ncbi:transmembrane sensor [Pedobacter africanus]|uniref:Ferric-dicitrate binding protein FerR (Iron transport regulator) n=1 Tax=Pedobacter africanus TaxID=151894 RepID=A0ACC6KZS8_9SPHI|nr:FecR domain-containing protein [Pedobacter africanus]MDR6784685.1 ferric-dicitrate binding protein FerR (iron transport regulator) [Pedobacter africanus]